MIMKCTSCGMTYDSAYGHYHCANQASPKAATAAEPAPVKETETRALVPVDVIEAWDLSYNLGVAVDMIGQFSMSADWEYLAEAIEALEREMRRAGGHR